MNPVFGFLLFFAIEAIVAIAAAKRGLRWWAYVLIPLVVTPVVVNLAARAGASSVGAGVLAMLVPVLALVVVLSKKNSEQLAIVHGEHGAFRKCPFCAEAVRREAKKCKHCGSELVPEHG